MGVPNEMNETRAYTDHDIEAALREGLSAEPFFDRNFVEAERPFSIPPSPHPTHHYPTVAENAPSSDLPSNLGAVRLPWPHTTHPAHHSRSSTAHPSLTAGLHFPEGKVEARAGAYGNVTILSALLLSGAVLLLVETQPGATEPDAQYLWAPAATTVVGAAVVMANTFGIAVMSIQQHHVLRLLSHAREQAHVNAIYAVWRQLRWWRSRALKAITYSLPLLMVATAAFVVSGPRVPTSSVVAGAMLLSAAAFCAYTVYALDAAFKRAGGRRKFGLPTRNGDNDTLDSGPRWMRRRNSERKRHGPIPVVSPRGRSTEDVPTPDVIYTVQEDNPPSPPLYTHPMEREDGDLQNSGRGPRETVYASFRVVPHPVRPSTLRPGGWGYSPEDVYANPTDSHDDSDPMDPSPFSSAKAIHNHPENDGNLTDKFGGDEVNQISTDERGNRQNIADLVRKARETARGTMLGPSRDTGSPEAPPRDYSVKYKHSLNREGQHPDSASNISGRSLINLVPPLVSGSVVFARSLLAPD